MLIGTDRIRSAGIAACVLSVLAAPACRAATPANQARFPGETSLPREAAGPEELAKILYGNRLTFIDRNNCGDAPCRVRIAASQTFKDVAGSQQAILVTAAVPTPDNASHPSGAVIGIAWVVHTPAGWTVALGSPTVATAGAFGDAPDAFIMDGGVWGKTVALQWSDLHQGEAERYWQLYVPDRAHRTFVLGLQLQTLNDSEGACPDTPPTAACSQDDFKTALHLATEADGIAVTATTSYPDVLHKPAISKTYHVTRSGLGIPATGAP